VPARYRELALYLVGFGLLGTCVVFSVIHFWEYFQAKLAFSAEVARGKPALSAIEKLEDRGRRLLPADAVYVYDEKFPTSGAYDPNWADAGFYNTPRSGTALVHSLERGDVVIYYDKPPPDVLDTLRQWAGLFHEDRDEIIERRRGPMA
jgi:hypothetical protein